MARLRRLALLALLVCAGCAPQPPSFDSRSNVNLPADLDRYLADSERRVTGLKPGTEKAIRWATSNKKKTPYSIVYFHGFSASKREISPVVERVADAIGANVYFVRFKGHGIKGVDGLAEGRAEDWTADAWEAMAIGKRIGEKVILMGMSMGGIPAVQIAIREPEVHSVILFAPVLTWNPWTIRLALSPVGRWVLWLLFGKTRSFKPVNDRHEYFWTTKYRVEALQSLFTLINVQRSTDLRLLTTRTLVFYAESDEFIPADAIEARFKEIGSGIKRLVHLDGASEHTITGEIVNPSTVPVAISETLRFLEEAGISIRNRKQ